MTPQYNIESNQSQCTASFRGVSQRILFLVIGGGIGATLALLFAPKPGRELRTDIATAASKSYEETLEAAHHLRERTSEYLETAKETGREVLDVVAARMSAVKEEVNSDVEKIGIIVEAHIKHASEPAGAGLGS